MVLLIQLGLDYQVGKTLLQKIADLRPSLLTGHSPNQPVRLRNRIPAPPTARLGRSLEKSYDRS